VQPVPHIPDDLLGKTDETIIVTEQVRYPIMSETVKMILMILLTIAAFIFALRVAGWRMKRACEFIIRDLKQKKAVDPASAVELPYCKSSLFHIGMRDYRPRALGELVKHDVVRVQDGSRYYLREGYQQTVLGKGVSA